MKKKSKKKSIKRKKKKPIKGKSKKIKKVLKKKSNFKTKKTKLKKNKIKKSKRKKKHKQPLERLRSIKFSKLKFKKIKVGKLKLKKKKLLIFKKKVIQIKNIGFQKVMNFILTPFFRAYDDFREKRKIEKLRNIAFEKREREQNLKDQTRLRYEAKQKELRDEIKFAREREQDLKKFIRHEQAILRKEQAEKRRRFLEEIKLEKKIESFRKRELEEIKNLEKIALREQREDYRPVEERLEKIKEKYRLIREQKIRERIEALGVEISDSDTREDLIKKEKEYAEQRLSIELVLESFYRSANSLVFQLNKRYIPKHRSILRVIDRRYESNECFIRYDDSPDEDWLILIYLEDSDIKKGKIIVENKANSEKHETKSFETKEIFTYSDYLVDSMTAHIDRERQKKNKIQSYN
jgi:hypothetical protein